MSLRVYGSDTVSLSRQLRRTTRRLKLQYCTKKRRKKKKCIKQLYTIYIASGGEIDAAHYELTDQSLPTRLNAVSINKYGRQQESARTFGGDKGRGFRTMARFYDAKYPCKLLFLFFICTGININI